MTTAQYRVADYNAEQSGDYAGAAGHWSKAINAYPCTGAVAELDKAKMGKRRDATLGMVA